MVKVGDVFKTNNFGDCEVIEYINSRNAVVKFIDTGYVVKTTSSVVERGQIRDKLSKSICGVGFIGDGKNLTHSNGRKTREYSVWKGMIERCYSESLRKNYPTYKNCYVCEEWHNFQNFAEWYKDNYPKDGLEYEIDKDLSSYGMSGKVYSPSTCLFVTRKVNSEESHAKSYRVRDPNGVIVDIYNMSEYCRNNNLNIGAMCRVGKGALGYHKGYKPL